MTLPPEIEIEIRTQQVRALPGDLAADLLDLAEKLCPRSVEAIRPALFRLLDQYAEALDAGDVEAVTLAAMEIADLVARVKANPFGDPYRAGGSHVRGPDGVWRWVPDPPAEGSGAPEAPPVALRAVKKAVQARAFDLPATPCLFCGKLGGNGCGYCPKVGAENWRPRA